MTSRRFLLLELEAPLMGLGGPRIDGRSQGYRVPTKSMVTGMIGNAAGIDRTQVDWLQQLQDGLGIACAILRPGEEFIEYQTADMSKPHMGGSGNITWSASGKPFKREGGTDALHGRRQQWRPYLADAHFILALWAEAELPLTLDEASAFLVEPMRNVFLGRACCTPTADLSMGVVEASSPLEALRTAIGSRRVVEFVMSYDAASPQEGQWTGFQVNGERNWRLDRHTGTQMMAKLQVRDSGKGNRP